MIVYIPSSKVAWEILLLLNHLLSISKTFCINREIDGVHHAMADQLAGSQLVPQIARNPRAEHSQSWDGQLASLGKPRMAWHPNAVVSLYIEHLQSTSPSRPRTHQNGSNCWMGKHRLRRIVAGKGRPVLDAPLAPEFCSLARCKLR